MKTASVGLVLALLFCGATAAPAVELSKIDRTIKKEPAYKHHPKYCLLVFGPEARTKVWLVQDGSILYVDRHADGDLTAPDDKVAADKSDGADEGEYSFQAGEIRDGTRLHKALSVSVAKLDSIASQDTLAKAFLKRHPKARGYSVIVEMDLPGWKGTGIGGRVQQQAFYVDANGVLQLAGRPHDAPVIHFGGPWQVTLFGAQSLTVGRATDVVLGVGTPGVGAGTTAWVEYEGIMPTNAYPTLNVTYPPRRPGEAPVHERYQLKQRC
jgi:hypothetical protein